MARYLPADADWRFRCRGCMPGWFPAESAWQVDGIIGRVADDGVATEFAAREVPVVNVSGCWSGTAFPRVTVDDEAIGGMGAEHFLDRGFRHFGFVGVEGPAYSEGRERGFSRALGDDGHRMSGFRITPVDDEDGLERNQARLQRWLAGLSKPVAVMAASDVVAWHVVAACRALDIRVPEEVAVLGVDDDAMVCELSRPQLSSVAVPWSQVGYRAAELMDRMLAGEAPPEAPILLPPREVVTRPSSDVLAVEDPDVAEALRFIRESATSPICVDDVLEVVPVSRRSLERRFRKALDCTISTAIRRAHVAQAKRLLAETDMPMPKVARGSGFLYPQRLSTVFKKLTGLTPTDYRRQYRTR